jgi:hypothetical protein
MNDRRTGTRDVRPVKKPLPGPRTTGSSVAARRALRGESVSHDPLLNFGRTNYLLMAGGAVLAAIGFILLRRGDISMAPLLLVLGYCAVIPLGIVWRGGGRAAGGGDSRTAKAGE